MLNSRDVRPHGCRYVTRFASFAWLVVLSVPAQAPALAQDIDELIRMRVEELQATGMLEIDGVSIASGNLIPRIYAARSFAPAWRSAAQIDSLTEVIEESYLEGLDPGDYHADAVRAARAAFAEGTAQERADTDIVLTDSVIRLGYHLRFGKVDPVELDPGWNFSRELVGRDPAETIQAAIDAPSMREFARQVIPRGFPYERLKAALAEYRAIAAAGWPGIGPGPTLKIGMSDARVPALAERLTATGDLEEGVAVGENGPYEETLADGVKRFQARHGLAQDGTVGPATLAALNVPVEERIAQIRANLERARWVFNELEDDFIVVNIAAFRLDVVRDRETVWQARVVVGQPYRRTPVFKATMRYLVFNPTWTVPPTVFRFDILPELRRNAGYLLSRNIDVLDADGNVVDPSTVDWTTRSGFPYRFVQRPGAANALGRVKFMFPNEQAVYLHDTPSRELFARESRAFSSGCIRVENPLDLARVLLGPGWDRARIDALIASGRTDTVFLENPITVMLLYSTTEVDDEGRVFFLPDIYERDAAVVEGLGEPFRAGGSL